MAVRAVKAVIDPATDTNVNLKMIKIVKKLGETVEESQMIDGALIEQKSMGHGGCFVYMQRLVTEVSCLIQVRPEWRRPRLDSSSSNFPRPRRTWRTRW